MMKGKTLCVLSVFLFAALVLTQSTALAKGDPARGKKIFDGLCFSCHGENGHAELPGVPVFANGERMEKSDAELMNSIKNGVFNPNNPGGAIMPPSGGGPTLTDQQIEDVLSYERTLHKK